MKDILKAALKTGSATLLTLLFGVVSAKVMAHVLGPEGTGLYSLLVQFVQTATILATLGGSTALIQGLASRGGGDDAPFLASVGAVFASLAGTIGIMLITGGSLFGRWFLGDEGLSGSPWLIAWLVVPIASSVWQVYFSGVLNGKRAIGKLAITNVAGSAATLAIVFPASEAAHSGRVLALVALLSLNAAVSGALAAAFCLREGWLRGVPGALRKRIASVEARRFLALSGTTLATGAMATATLLAIRTLLVRSGSLAQAGYFNVCWTLSTTYVALLFGTLTTYYLPTLAALKDDQERGQLIERFLRLGPILLVPILVGLSVLKPLVVRILYTRDFMQSLDTLRWMLVGDYFKVAGWALALPLLAYARTRAYFLSELLWNVAFLTGSALSLIVWHWPQGVGASFMVAYGGYCVWLAIDAIKSYRLPIQRKVMLTWFGGLALVVGAALQEWNARAVPWPLVPLWLGLAIAYSWFGVTPWERDQLRQLVARRAGRLRVERR